MISSRQRDGLLISLGWAYIFYAYFVESLSGMPTSICPLRYLTGMPCPLCGTTLAWEAFLHGNPALAYSRNPAAPLLLIVWVAVTIFLTTRLAMNRAHHEARANPATRR